jgi:hypothetical protein
MKDVRNDRNGTEYRIWDQDIGYFKKEKQEKRNELERLRSIK